MCTIFLDKGEFCEPCSQIVESEEYVSVQSETLNKPATETLHAEPDEPPSDIQRRREQDKVYIWGGVVGASLMIAVAMGLYAFPNLFTDSAVLAAQAEEQRLEDCRLVFEEITYVLRAGEVPDETMACEGSPAPNLIRRTGDVVRVDHPNPAAYGLSEIYVTNESHQVFLVGRGSS